MALAEKLRLTSRGQKIASARSEENEMNFAMGQMTSFPRAAAAEYSPMTPEAGGRLAARGRPTPLVEVRPQGRIQQHTLEHIVGFSPFVQVPDALVSLMVDQPVEVLNMLDSVFTRAGYRSAQDLLLILSFPRGSPRAADGGAAVGSANGRGGCRAARRADL